MSYRPSVILRIPDEVLDAVAEQRYLEIEIRGCIYSVKDFSIRSTYDPESVPEHTMSVTFIGEGEKVMEGTDLTQLDKLERYLREKGIPYERVDEKQDWEKGSPERHQIMSPSRANWEWDAVCQYGSYGWQEGLLETMGILVAPDYGDSVEGHLTADELIERIEALKDE